MQILQLHNLRKQVGPSTNHGKTNIQKSPQQGQNMTTAKGENEKTTTSRVITIICLDPGSASQMTRRAVEHTVPHVSS